MHRLRRFVADLPAWAAFGWTLWTLLTVHLFFLRPPTALLHFYDEGYINAFAWRMIDGHMLPYVDAVSHRGPMLYWIAAVAAMFASPTSWVPIRICSMVATMLPVIFVFAAAHRARKALAGGVAAITTVVALLLAEGPGDGIAFNGEHVLNVFATAAFLSLVIALDRRRAAPSLALVALSGALAAMSALSKQVGVVMIPALALWVIAAAVSRTSLTRSRRWRLVAAFGVGAVVPVAVVVVRYAAAHELGTFVYWAVRYNSEIYMAPYKKASWRAVVDAWMSEHAVLLALALVTIGWGLARPIARADRWANLARAWDEEGFLATVALEALLAIAASNAALRDFPHYYVQVVPWCGLLLGLLIEYALGTGLSQSVYRAALARSAVILPALVLVGSVWGHRYRAYKIDRSHNAWIDSRNGPICAFVRDHSKPTDKLFVWGFLPELYTSCGRKAASRYVFTTFVAGVVPWFGNTSVEDEDALAVPGSRETLLSELEATKPPVIVDSQGTLANRPMNRYAILAKYLEDHYCAAGEQQGLKVYLRKTAEGDCPP